MKEPTDDTSTGLPWPKRWGGVYGLVMGVFVVWVALLSLLSRLFP
jgi:hypothetical protein